jgi:hypothetical protein
VVVECDRQGPAKHATGGCTFMTRIELEAVATTHVPLS